MKIEKEQGEKMKNIEKKKSIWFFIIINTRDVKTGQPSPFRPTLI